MALMKCPACGQEITEKSATCIHCGYPLEQSGVNGNSESGSSEKLYKLILKQVTNDGKYETIRIVREASGCGLAESKNMVETLPQSITSGLTYEDAQNLKSKLVELGGTVSVEEDLPAHVKKDIVADTASRRPKCPACQSANIAKLPAQKSGLISGVLSLAKGNLGKTMECKTCGHKW